MYLSLQITVMIKKIIFLKKREIQKSEGTVIKMRPFLSLFRGKTATF